MQLVVTVVLARLLQPEDFGLMAMVMVFTSFSVLLIESGLGSALVQRQTTSPDEESSVFVVNLGLGCMLTVLLWLCAPAIAHFYRQPALLSLVQLMVWVLPLSALATVPAAVLTQRLDFRSRMLAELFASGCGAGLALLLAWHGQGVSSLAWQIIAAAGVRMLLLWYLSGWRPRGRFDAPALVQLLRFGGPLLLANLLNVASTRLQSLLIGRLFDARTLGFYAIAQDTQQAPAQFLGSLLNRVGLPMFSIVANQPEKLAGALRLSLRLSVFVFTPCMMGIAVIATPLIRLLYGDNWAPAGPLLSLLALSAVFWPLHVLNLAAVSAIGKADLVLRLEIVKTLVTIPLVMVAAFIGVTAVAGAVFISSLLCVVINTWHSQRLFGYGLRAQLRDALPTVVLALMSTGVAALGLRSSIAASASMPTAIFVAAFSAACTYVIGAASSRLQAWRDLLSFVRTLWSRSPAGQGELK
ncbi:lipopolysaccharide biosynthesis protein [Luteimonas sp. SMYT11W]|uniref:Lipopolysaccharide biosynthesis protein n=1 Tax=Luteimonas flava TaxID=3115822 RepID=A0ABU7WKV7_9GAMM